MGIRQNATSVSQRLRERVRSTLLEDTESAADRTTRGDDGSDDGVPDSVGNLFHCSRCGVVYIATDKRVCAQCDEDVEQVRSTLACNRP